MGLCLPRPPRPSGMQPVRALTYYVSCLIYCRPWCRRRQAVLVPCFNWDLHGWRGDCLAARLVRRALCHYCLGVHGPLLVCAWRSGQVTGARRGHCCFLFSPAPPRASRAACSGLLPQGVPCPCLLVRLSRWPVRSASLVRLPFLVREACPLCGCALTLPLCPRSSPPLAFSHANIARYPRGVLVGPLEVLCAPRCFLVASLAPPA